jgi:hypothetical protein
VPTVAVAGKLLKSGTMSEPVVTIVAVAVLLPATLSLVAPVVPDIVELPIAVGVPETVHEIVPPGDTVAGGVGEHEAVKPEGNPDTAHDALVAATAGAAAFKHVNEPT